TEEIQVVLDTAERLEDYRFVKRSCGQGIGSDSLLMGRLGGWPADAILACAPSDLLERVGPIDEIETFLLLKHLFAIQAVLEMWTGRMEGGHNAPCTAVGIEFDGEKTRIDAEIPIDTLTERIKACGACGSCGKKENVAAFPPRMSSDDRSYGSKG
ncbi:MAG: hypothetical protein D6812_08330, partial [Deltaproteobacteria bacterium]